MAVGCRALLLAILMRAASDWVLYRTSSRLKNKQLADDAYHWIFEEEPGDAWSKEREKSGSQLTSFLSICDALDLDPTFVRTTIRRMTVKDVLSVGRPAVHRKIDTSESEGPAEIASVPRSGYSQESERMFHARPVPLLAWPRRFGWM